MLDLIVKEGFTPGHPVLFSVIKNWGLHLFDISTSNSSDIHASKPKANRLLCQRNIWNSIHWCSSRTKK